MNNQVGNCCGDRDFVNERVMYLQQRLVDYFARVEIDLVEIEVEYFDVKNY